MTTPYRKKLIEVALPLEEINVASAREKSIRHGHPSTLHLWWARRPLATCRAVLFSSIIDDPGEDGVPQGLLNAIDLLPLSRKYRHLAEEEPLDEAGQPLGSEVAEREKIAKRRRYRLFTFIERLVQWENSNDPETLEIARHLIREATEDKPPPVLDPFCGGGSIPLEAQRLGLEAHASDLNPVAVLITKAMIEIPPKFANMPPVNSDGRLGTTTWTGAQGLADDVRYYGQWMRQEAERRIGDQYPKVHVTAEMAEERPDLKPLIGQKLTVIAWLWARTVPSPDPAAQGAHVPLVRSFVLSSKKGKEAWVEPLVDIATMSYRLKTRIGVPPDLAAAGTKSARGANFRCLLTGTTISGAWIRQSALSNGLGQELLAIVVDGPRGRIYLSPTDVQCNAASVQAPKDVPRESLQNDPKNIWCYGYGLTKVSDLFTPRQLVALATFNDLLREAWQRICSDSLAVGVEGSKAAAYANAVITYLAFAVDKGADYWSSICSWHSSRELIRNTFGRQAIPMVWDFAECNPLSDSTGNWSACIDWVCKAVQHLPGSRGGEANQADATIRSFDAFLFSTDPPYFDNIAYADLSDFFYAWLRRSLGDIYPELFSTLVTPKSEELIATPYRHGGSRERATQFFENGLRHVFARVRAEGLPEYPTTIYYAFKQSETEESNEDGGIAETTSTGWESMLQGLVDAGLSVNGTWPTRTELGNRMIASGTNALGSCIVLVCRPRSEFTESITRREFLSQLRKELPPALAKLTQGDIAPVDLAQAAIGPGMAVFSRYAAVLEADGKPMRVRPALALINQALDEALATQEGWYDSQTRFAVTWFHQRGFADGPYGEAEILATAKDAPVGTMAEAGIVRSGGGKVKLLSREELPVDYDPAIDKRVTIWEATQYLARALDQGGELQAARMMRRFRDSKPDLDVDRARELAYRLYSICDQKRQAQEARVYNALVLSWSDIEAVSQTDEAAWQFSGGMENLFSEV